MGLDMYLRGEKFYWSIWNNPDQEKKEDDYSVETVWLRLGYWRKHPNLHGYIVNTFAEGKDECQDIWLDVEHIEQIIQAIKDQNLPHTEGFFFGSSERSDPDELQAMIDHDVAIFEKALAWLKDKQENMSKSVYYKASW